MLSQALLPPAMLRVPPGLFCQAEAVFGKLTNSFRTAKATFPSEFSASPSFRRSPASRVLGAYFSVSSKQASSVAERHRGLRGCSRSHPSSGPTRLRARRL